MSYCKPVLFCATVAVSIIVSTQSVFALRGKLSSPAGIGFLDTYPEYARKEVRSALQQKGCTFIDGSFINAVSTLHFNGDSPSLNTFLGKLARCPATTVSVSFEKLEHDCDWRLLHDADSNEFHITVNLLSDRINIEDLVIPPAKGPDVQR